MTQPGSMDPFSTFLNVTSGSGTPPADDRASSRADVLRALLALRPAGGGPVPLRDLSRELNARTTQVAVLLAALDEDQLVTIGASAADDLVALTDAGVAAAEALANEDR